MIFVKIGDKKIPALIIGTDIDREWDNRESVTITLETTYEEVVNLFTNNAKWSAIWEDDAERLIESVTTDEEGNVIPSTLSVTFDPVEHDHSDYCISGEITDHRDGTISIKMGKMTELEEAYEIMYGGTNNE